MSLTSYPVGLDTFTQPQKTDTMDGSTGGTTVDHTLQHQQLNAAVMALEAVIGVTGSYNFGSVTLGPIRAAVKVAAWTNTEVTTSPPSGAATIDSYAVHTGDRVLLTNQTVPKDGGMWVANTTGAWTRPTDWAAGSTIPEGTLVVVGGEGTYNYGQIVATTTSHVVGTGTMITVSTLPPSVFAFSLTDAGPTGYVNLTVNQLNVQNLSFGAAVGSNPSRLFQYAGNPNTHVTAIVKGDLVLDTSTPALWQATATGNASWVGIASLASPTFTGTPAAPTAAVGTNSTQLATTAFVQTGAPVNVVSTVFTTNAYTFVLADELTAQQASNGATAGTITVPTNASVAFPVGTVITVTQTGTGKIQIAAAGGVTITSSITGGFVSGTTGCRAQYSTIGLLKTATNTWVISGDAA